MLPTTEKTPDKDSVDSPPSNASPNGDRAMNRALDPDSVYKRLVQMDRTKGKSSGQVRTMSNILFAVELRMLRLRFEQYLQWVGAQGTPGSGPPVRGVPRT